MKKWMIGFAITIVLGTIAYLYIFQAPENVSKANSEFTIKAIDLARHFSTNLAESSSKYHDKIFTVKGLITQIENNSITIDHVVYCKFDENIEASINEHVMIKGKFIGYDDLFEIVKLDQCIRQE